MDDLDLRQRRQCARIALDGDHLRGAFEQQRARQPAGTRPDLDRRAAGQIASGARDPAREIEIVEEVLAEGFARGQPVFADGFGERRKAVAHALISTTATRRRSRR
jgi:hypothetical protein